VFSTTLELAGLKPPGAVSSSDGSGRLPLASVSLAPILFREAESVREPDRDYILTETHDLMRGGIREVAARNGTHKVLCTDAASPEQCTFYDLAADPLEEYPLEEPASCSGYADGTWSSADAAWHFCRLTDVIASHSFL
jgi:hypothetical protein